ncbi:reverse transcriptase domain-containing protein [Tanacetum coccineum]|uniref:Reverse transcriptase domain-containing protein n=1 Tax=Tanacetum coccineum TaxID=301880 RepID=A0ABQ5GNE1_9ASTR
MIFGIQTNLQVLVLLPSNNIPTQERSKAITIVVVFSYDGPPIPSRWWKRKVEVTKVTELSEHEGQPTPPFVQNTTDKKPIEELSLLLTRKQPILPDPSRLNKYKRLREKEISSFQRLWKFSEIFTLSLSFADALIHMPKVRSDVASINLMLLSHLEKLQLPALTKTKMVLEFSRSTISKPTGVAENVFVKVGKFYFPADFVVLDFIADPRVPLILGRPFLRTGSCFNDVYEGEITLGMMIKIVTLLNVVMLLSHFIQQSRIIEES